MYGSVLGLVKNVGKYHTCWNTSKIFYPLIALANGYRVRMTFSFTGRGRKDWKLGYVKSSGEIAII